WENVSPKGAPKWLMINSIEPSPFDAATCYVAGTLYKEGDFNPYLYRTTDYGKTWTKIVNGIENEHFTRVLRADPNQKGLLYAGTETGMYISFNDGRKWEKFQLNLPIVPITDLTIKDNNLIVATQGRSLWVIDDLTVLYQLSNDKKGSSTILYKPKDSYRTKGGGGHESKTTGANHPNGVITHFYLKDFDQEKDTVAITYFDKKGDSIISFGNHNEENKIKKL
ncbi:unnamed protein product, partial [Ectocarpus sp. 4 AP-2014]